MTGLSNGFVCLMGMGTVFVGLICIVFICKLLGVVLTAVSKPEKGKSTSDAGLKTEHALSPDEKAEIIAGACACIAEELGADVVQVIGSKFILYKQSKENKTIVLVK